MAGSDVWSFFTKLRQPRSLRTLFIGLFIAQILPSLGLIIWLSNRSKHQTVEDLVKVITSETSQRVAVTINDELESAIHLNQINQDFASMSNIKSSYAEILKAFLIQLENFPNIVALGVSQTGGYTIRLNRFGTPPNEYQLEVIQPNRPNELQISRVNLAGQKLADLQTVKPFTLNDWPWYRSIQNINPNSWSQPYISRDGYSLVISTYAPIINPKTKKVETIFVSTLRFQQLYNLLRQQKLQANALVLISEPDGHLIGSSIPEDPYFFTRTGPGKTYQFKRRQLKDSRHPVIAALQPLLPQAKTLKPGESKLLSFQLNGQRYFAKFERLNFDPSLSWLLVTAISEKEFTQAGQDNLHLTLLICALLILILSLINFSLAQAIIRPIKKLQKKTKTLTDEPESAPQKVIPIKEIQDLHLAFREMTEKIQQTLSQLQISNRELDEQRTHLAQILDALPVGVGIHEPDGQLSYMNPAGLKLLGLEKLPDFHGTHTLNQDFHLYQVGKGELYPTEKLPAVQALQGKITEIEDIEVRTGENKHVFAVRSTPLYNQAGTIEAALVAFLDITDRQHVEEILENYNAILSQEVAARTQALQKSEEKFRFALESTVTSWWDWDIVNNSIEWSDNFYPMVGRTPQNCPPRIESFFSCVYPEDQERVNTAIQATLVNNAPYRVEFRFLHPDQTICWVMATGTLKRDETGRPIRMSGINLDITERKQAEEALQKSEERLQLALSSTGISWWNWDILSDTVTWSENFYTMIGREPQEFSHTLEGFCELVYPADQDFVAAAIENTFVNNAPYRLEFRFLRPDLSICWTMVTGTLKRDETGRPIRMSGINLDITERKQIEEALQKSEQRLRMALESTSTHWWERNIKTGETNWSNSWELVLGYELNSLNKHQDTFFELLHPEDCERVRQEVEETIRTGHPLQTEFRLRNADGSYAWMLETCNVEYDESGEPIRISGLNINITPLKEIQTQLEQANTELERLTQIDALTGVYNRRYFDQALEREWQIAFRESQHLALLMLDIDYFKLYNDTLGHQAGDFCLHQVATVLSQAIHRTSDLVARYGGEEFAVILPRTDAPGAIVIAQRIQTLMAAKALHHPASSISSQITLSIGIHAAVPRPGTPSGAWVKNADDALYQAKQQGRNRYVVLEDVINAPTKIEPN